MKYLSIDIEATGVYEKSCMVEFACVPFDAAQEKLESRLSFHRLLKCPPFEDLKENLDVWVQENLEDLLRKAHQEGVSQIEFKRDWTEYLTSGDLTRYFENEPIVLFGKSLSAIDIPFLRRDLGWDFMRQHFSHKTMDLTCLTYALIDSGKLPAECSSGSELMKHFELGEVAHTAMEDAVNTAQLYFKLKQLF